MAGELLEAKDETSILEAPFHAWWIRTFMAGTNMKDGCDVHAAARHCDAIFTTSRSRINSVVREVSSDVQAGHVAKRPRLEDEAGEG